MLLVGYPPFHGDEAGMLRRIRCGHMDWSHKSRWRQVSDEARTYMMQQQRGQQHEHHEHERA
jgi:hypothetical protein